MHGENNIIYIFYNTQRNFIFVKLKKRLYEYEQLMDRKLCENKITWCILQNIIINNVLTKLHYRLQITFSCKWSVHAHLNLAHAQSKF